MNKVILISIGAAISFGFAAINYAASDDTLEQVQAGTITLQCHMSDGVRTIAPNQVTGLMDGVWLFDNGHARNCEVVKDAR